MVSDGSGDDEMSNPTDDGGYDLEEDVTGEALRDAHLLREENTRLRREMGAKSVCRACPVRAECAAHALSVREPYGVWGGFSESERLRLLALGWEDLADRRQTKVDIARLEARLGRPHNTAVPDQRKVA